MKRSGDSSWWIIRTEESFNGQRSTGQGNFIEWFSSTAFGGVNYSNTPVGAVTHVEEPGLRYIENSLIYFGDWQAGKNFAICAWNSRYGGMKYFQAVGDPFVKKIKLNNSMKNIKTEISLIMFLIVTQNGFSQVFSNLNFESANPSGYTAGGSIPTSIALPNWTAYYGSSTNPTVSGSLTTIYYDGYSLGGAIVALQDTNAPSSSPLGISLLPIQGNYSVLLEGSIPFAAVLASIGQTGTIPNTAQSLTFFGNLAGNLQGTFNGQPLSYMDISNALNYTIWGANISAYAGQTGQLLFTVPVQSFALLDNIQFSSLPVPEPSELALVTLGTLFFSFRRCRNTS